MSRSEPIAYVWFTDGVKRAVYEERGRQFVLDEYGEPIYGVWYIPPEECVIPNIVDLTASPD
jgi:hypothetical protein